MIKMIIAGYGPVGKAAAFALEQNPNIEIFIDDPALGYEYDIDSLRTQRFYDEPDGVLVCVSTPMLDDGTCNTSNVKSIFEKYRGTKFCIKSAVDPEWLDDYAFINRNESSFTCSPEFLRGSHVHANPTSEFMNQTFAIYGGEDCRWWDEIFSTVLPKIKDVKYCTLQQAAFAKYVENCFLATKVTFFNEIYGIFTELGFKGFDAMVDAITLDPRIGKSHTQVPGPDGKFGYGGHCLPKDMACLRSLSSDTPLLDAVTDINESYRDD